MLYLFQLKLGQMRFSQVRSKSASVFYQKCTKTWDFYNDKMNNSISVCKHIHYLCFFRTVASCLVLLVRHDSESL